MTDLGGPHQPARVPPPPPPPPPPYGSAPTGGAPYASPTPAGAWQGQPAAKPPRPAVVAGSVVQLVGAVLMGVACFLVWYKVDGTSFDGFDQRFDDESSDGAGVMFMAVILAGLALASLFARRVLAVAIISVVSAAFGVLVAIGALGNASDIKDLADLADADFTWGPGPWLVLVGSLAALAGSIMVLSKRRRWR